MMVGIVVVSHSAPLARAAVDLALEMAHDSPPEIRVAAGTKEGVTGTNAVAIAQAIDELASPDGVLVLMDLGSSVLSAEMARDLRSTNFPVLLSPGPLVEGLLAAVVLAGAGASLEAVAREADGALGSKRQQLVSTEMPWHEANPMRDEPAADAVSFEAMVHDPAGLHSRPAGVLVNAASRYDADIRIYNLDGRTGPVSAKSLLSLMTLGITNGCRIRVTASGEQANEAVAEIKRLIEGGFGSTGQGDHRAGTDGGVE